ncbi:MAG: c-type cytochrome [Sulfuriferula sp.]
MLILFTAALPGWAAGEHQQRLQVEIAVLYGDTRMLLDPATPPLRRQGLRQRIRSSLGTLGILTRYAIQDGASSPAVLKKQITDLRQLFGTDKLPAFARLLQQLKTSQPLDISGFLPLTPTPLRLRTGQSIYQNLCMGCHLNPDKAQPNPAPNLFSMAKTLPRDEFIARVLGGIHGVPLTSLENPFTNEEIISMTAYFRQGPPAQ